LILHVGGKCLWKIIQLAIEEYAIEYDISHYDDSPVLARGPPWRETEKGFFKFLCVLDRHRQAVYEGSGSVKLNLVSERLLGIEFQLIDC
jgi:hypothetical protein